MWHLPSSRPVSSVVLYHTFSFDPSHSHDSTCMFSCKPAHILCTCTHPLVQYRISCSTLTHTHTLHRPHTYCHTLTHGGFHTCRHSSITQYTHLCTHIVSPPTLTHITLITLTQNSTYCYMRSLIHCAHTGCIIYTHTQLHAPLYRTHAVHTHCHTYCYMHSLTHCTHRLHNKHSHTTADTIMQIHDVHTHCHTLEKSP